MSPEWGVRPVPSPYGYGSTVSVGGIEVITLDDDETSGADAPKKTIERGAEITQRNVLIPHSGTINGAVEPEGFGPLRGLTDDRGFVTVTSSEGSIPRCVVENVDRKNQGDDINAFRVSIDWRQVFIGEVSVVELTAVTSGGSKSPKAGSKGANNEPEGLIDHKEKHTNGPNADTSGSGNNNGGGGGGGGGGNGGNGNNESGNGGGGGILGGIGNSLGGFFS